MPRCSTSSTSLPSIPTPDRTASPLRRARTLARLLADDADGAALLPNAGAALTERLNARLDGLAAEHKAAVEANVEDLLAATVRASRITTVGEDIGRGARGPARSRPTRGMSPGTASGSSTRCARASARRGSRIELAAGARQPTAMRVRVRCAALLRVDGVVASIEETATEWVKEQLDRFRVEIAEHDRRHARRLHARAEQTTSLETVTVELRDNERAATKDRDGEDLPRYPGHLFADADGHVPGRPQRLGAPGRRGGDSRGRASSPGTGTRAAPRRRRCGSPTRTTRTSGRRSSPTSSSSRAARTAPSAPRSSTRTATTWPTPAPSSARWPTSPSTSATGSSASSRSPRSTTAPSASSTSPTLRPRGGPRLRGRQGHRALPVRAFTPISVKVWL